MLAGVLPETYWSLTPAETALLMQGYYVRDMQIATLTAAFINVHRDPKSGRPVEVEDVSVFARTDRKPVEPQTPEQQWAILEAVTLAMGGEVPPRG